MSLIFIALLAGCSDYLFSSHNDAYEEREHPTRDEPGDDDDTADSDFPADDPDDDDSGAPGDSDEPVEDPDDTEDEPDDDPPGGAPNDPPDDEPPAVFINDDCAFGDLAEFSEEQIYVLSWDPVEASGTLVAPHADWYHVYNESIVESGSSQRNESAYFRVPNTGNPSGVPAYSNCGNDYVVADADNYGFPSGSVIYIGTFWLESGSNTLTMYHYCPLQRAGQCGSFHDTADSSATCSSSNANSVHFYGHGLCLVTARD